MTSDDSVRPDASTMHRSKVTEPFGIPPTSPVATSPAGSTDDKSASSSELSTDSRAQKLAQDKTVIRDTDDVSALPHPARPGHTPAAVAKVLLGQRLNHFLLEEMIGGGGMGAVFRAHDEQLDRVVAVKVVPFAGDDPDLQRRFRNEAQSVAKLDHPRIAKVFDAGSHGQWHYIVFEYVEGNNIRDLVHRRGPLGIDDAVLYTTQLADALQHASDRGIVHRDVKPSNVLIATNGKIKLVDMGLARSASLEVSEDMTASGVTLGTFDYISPEQANDPRDADFRSDIYSLGCTLYYMLTGQPPYPGGTMLQKLLNHGQAAPPDPRELRSEISGNLVAVIQRMLAKKPDDRYQKAKGLIADLRVVASLDGLRLSPSQTPFVADSKSPLLQWFEKNLAWIATAAVILVIAAWMQFSTAVSDFDLPIPESAKRPIPYQPPTVGQPVPTPAQPSPDDQPSLQAAAQRDNRQPIHQVSVEDAIDGNTFDGAGEAQVDWPRRFSPAEEQPKFIDLPRPVELRPFELMTPNASGIVDSLAARSIGSRLGSAIDETLGARDPDIATTATKSPNRVRVIGPTGVVSNDPTTAGITYTTSLQEALQIVDRQRISHIEIAVPMLVSEPVRVETDDLLITSTVGGSVIVFESAGEVVTERSRMVSVGSNQVEFNDLHFIWNVHRDEFDGGSLLDCNENCLVRMTDCSVTINNPANRDEVYALDIITDPDTPRAFGKQARPGDENFPLVEVELNNVIMRGQMTMLHMDCAAKLWLDWDNGLLAVTGCMIETAGAHAPTSSSEPINLYLTRLTSHTPAGVIQMRLTEAGAHLVPINRVARKSLFVVDSRAPHFDFRGMPSLSSVSLLKLEGASNAYLVDPALTDPMLRLSTVEGQASVTQMGDLSPETDSWREQNAPRWIVNWSNSPLTDAPMNGRKPADYRQQETQTPGFDEKSLPQLPALQNFSSQDSSRIGNVAADKQESRL